MSLTVEERRDVMYAVKHFQNHHISPSSDRYNYFTHILEKIESGATQTTINIQDDIR